MSLYASDGSINVNVITSGYVGLYGSNGAWNVISDSGFGYEDPATGALRITLTDVPVNSIYAPDGSMYVSFSPYVSNTLKITVISGSLGFRADTTIITADTIILTADYAH